MAWMVNLRAAPGRLLVSTLLITMLTISGCGGKNTPPVCSDINSLKSSVSALTDVKLQQGSLSTLRSKLDAVDHDLAKLKSSAKSQFGSEIDAVDSAAAAFKSALNAAIAQPSTATVAAAGVALIPLKTALSDLESAVKQTC